MMRFTPSAFAPNSTTSAVTTKTSRACPGDRKDLRRFSARRADPDDLARCACLRIFLSRSDLHHLSEPTRLLDPHGWTCGHHSIDQQRCADFSVGLSLRPLRAQEYSAAVSRAD